MPLTRIARRIAPALLAPALMLGAGCDLLDQFEDGGGLVNFYSAHHGTVLDGQFPDKPSDHILINTDTGWEVVVTKAFVTTVGVTLTRCDGGQVEADFYWGALCENLVDPDLEPFGVGAVQADAGNYCAATITYGPFEDGANADSHNADGDTIYFEGVARKGDLEVPFSLSSRDTVAVQVDLSSINNGGPMVLEHDESFAKELTFTKTYDRFFDGIKFDEMGSMDMESVLVSTLEFETGVVLGTEITP